MPELIASAAAYLPLTLGPLLLLLLAPMFGSQARRVIAVILLCGALALAFFAIAQMNSVAQLHVVNNFPAGPDGELKRFLIETVEAPAWRWPAFAALMLGIPGLLLLLRRETPARPPHPVAHGVALGLWAFLLRLGLEKTAAPGGLVWASGLTFAVAPIVLFSGIYAGRRGWRFGRFVGGLFTLAFLQRIVLVAFSYYATTRHAGTHLDVGPVEDVAVGPLRLEPGATLTQKWLYATLVPHLTIWIVFTVVVGLVLGGIGWTTSRRRGTGH